MSQVVTNLSILFCYVKPSYDGNSVTLAPSSEYNHYGTSLGRFQNIPIIVGGSNNQFSATKKVEELNSNLIWDTLADFPFVEKSIFYYSMVTFQDSLFLFGKKR